MNSSRHIGGIVSINLRIKKCVIWENFYLEVERGQIVLLEFRLCNFNISPCSREYCEISILRGDINTQRPDNDQLRPISDQIPSLRNWVISRHPWLVL